MNLYENYNKEEKGERVLLLTSLKELTAEGRVGSGQRPIFTSLRPKPEPIICIIIRAI